MRILYFDCFSGAAGDMILGALLDAGLPFEALQRALGSLAVDGWQVSADRVLKGGITAVKFRVHELAAVASAAEGAAGPGHGHHHLREIRAAIDRSALSAAGKARAHRMFTRLAEAEAAIHGMPVEQVHLHEVGAIDSIVDIVGAVFALEWFAADRIVVSPINVGGGMVPIGARRLPGAGPGDAAAARRRADLLERHPGRAADPDRRAGPERVRHRLRPGAGDARSSASATAPATASCPRHAQRGAGDGRHRRRRAGRRRRCAWR